MQQEEQSGPNHLHALLREYMKLNGITSKELGKKLNQTPDNIRFWLNKPAKYWTVGRLKEYCDAIGIPYCEIFNAAFKK